VVASFKLRRHDRHVWVMDRGAAAGRTLRGAAADRAFALGEALFVLACPSAPERVRAVSVDLDRGRLLATVEVEGDKPRPVRHDGEAVRAAVSDALLAHLRA